MSTDTPAQRAAFEAWFAESRKSKGPSRRPTFERLEDGTYADDSTQRHWWTWQHAASPQPTAAQPLTDERIKELIPDGDAWEYEVGFSEATEFARAIEAEVRAALSRAPVPPPLPLEEPTEDSLYWHALNYRTAAPQHAEGMWQALLAYMARRDARIRAAK